MLCVVSAEKLGLLRQMCTELGVYTIPKCIEGVWIVPLYSWYHASFDTEPDVPGALPVQKVGHWLPPDCTPTCDSCLPHQQLLFEELACTAQKSHQLRAQSVTMYLSTHSLESAKHRIQYAHVTVQQD